MRRLFVAALATLAMTAGTISVTGPAQANDGRAVNDRGEIRAVLHHTMGRNPDGAQPDHHSVPHYMAGVKSLKCQWGVLDATYRMATSEEAKRRWGHNPQHLAGMLYAALLNRAPDPDGLKTYTWAIQVHGLDWATRQMMGSNEYLNRQMRYCSISTPGPAAGMYNWETALDYAKNTLLPHAARLFAACGATKALEKVTSIRPNPTPVQLFVGVTGEITAGIHGALDGTCELGVTYVKAAWEIGQIIMRGGDGRNSVFIQMDRHKSLWTANMITYSSVRVGPNPTNWKAYQGKTAAG